MSEYKHKYAIDVLRDKINENEQAFNHPCNRGVKRSRKINERTTQLESAIKRLREE